MIDLLKSIFYFPKIIGAAPYDFNKDTGEIKINYLFYSWIVVFLACCQRFYIIWCRFFVESFFVSNQITTITNILSSFLYDIYNGSICFSFCMKNVHEIRDVLIKIRNFSKTELKFDPDDSKFVRYCSHGISFGLTFLFLAIHLAYYFYNPFSENDGTRHLLFSLFFVFTNPIGFSLSIQFLSLTLIVFVMIRKINVLMRVKLQDILQEDLRSQLFKNRNQREINVKENIKSVKRFRVLFDSLQDLIEEIVAAFSTTNFFGIGYCFIDVLYSTNYFVLDKPGEYNLLYSIWMSYLFSRLYFTMSMCSFTIGQANATAQYLHELLVENDDPEMKEELEIFTLQLMHRKIEFSAWGFFKLDFALLYSMIGAVVTYTVILMQFQDASNLKSHSKNYPCQPGFDLRLNSS